MRGNIGRWRALANLGFAVAVLAMAGLGLHQVAGRQWRVQPTFHVRAQFDSIAGLEVGHRVRVQGIDSSSSASGLFRLFLMMCGRTVNGWRRRWTIL